MKPMNDRAGRTELALTMGKIRLVSICLLLALLLLVSWRSLFSLSMLNLGYVRLVDALLANDISFSEAEPLCPQRSLLSSDHMTPYLTEALVAMERSLYYRQSLSPYLGMGMIYLTLGDSERATQVLQTALSKDQSNLRAHTLLGCAYLQSGMIDSAIAQWQNVPHFREWRITRGHKLRLEGNWEASNRDYMAVVQVNPSSYLYHLMAWNYTKLGQIDKAIAAYKHAIKLSQPENSHYVPEMSRLELAKLYIGQQDWHNAKLELEAAISGQPNMAEAYEQLGVVYYMGFNDFQFANSLLLRAIEINPNAAKSYLYLGSFNRAQKEYALAEQWLSAGLTLSRNMWTPWLHGELGRVYLEQGRCTEAIPHLKAVIDAIPTDTWYLELLGDAYRGSSDLQMARQYYNRVIELYHANTRVKGKLQAIHK